MKDPIIQLDAKLELLVRRNDDSGAVLELWYVDYKEQQGQTIKKRIGDLFTFYDSEHVAEWTVPHWVARLFFLQDCPVRKELAQVIGRILLNHTSCKEPMMFTAYPYLGYDDKLVEGNLSFAIEFGKVFDDD
jgi:hypothetical protein